MTTILKANQITKSYKMGADELKVLRGVDLEINRGEYSVIVGASGSGKSTLLHILGALDRPDGGSIEFEGANLAQFGSGRLNKFRNRSIGFIFQFYHLLNELNVLENVMVPTMAGTNWLSWQTKKADTKKKAAELLEKVGLKERIKHKPYQLSGGERQRVAIARALMNDPKLLLADEPTGNLDSETGNGILEILKQLNQQGQTIVMVTHDTRISDKASRLIKIVDGRVA